MGEWNFSPEAIQAAREISIGDRVMVHWSEAECPDQEATVIGVQIERYGRASYAVHIDGDLSPTDGFYHDRSGHDAGSISLVRTLSASRPAMGVKPLEWRKPEGEMGSLRRAETAVGVYRVWTYAEADQWYWSLIDGVDTASGSGSQQQCVDAAQADYERRILSALEDTGHD